MLRAGMAIVCATVAMRTGVARAQSFGVPMPGLTTAQRARFDAGRAAFETSEEADEGLGPVFNGTSCAQCHSVGGTGGGSDLVETRFGRTMSTGAFDPIAERGGSLIQTTGIGVAGACNFVGETVPAESTITAGRRTTPLFGLGLVDAVPDAYWKVLAALERRYLPATAGRPNMVTDVTTGATVVGKFGWKSQVPSLLQFSGDAYLNEMGVTTPMFPHELCPQGDCSLLACDPLPDPDDADLDDVEAFHDFMSMLAPPSPPRQTAAVRQGAKVFDQVGCASCHLPTLVTGRNEVAAVSQRTFHPYSDFLLHDMGALGDGIPQGISTAQEMRTAPLWGLRLMTTYLHDGRAKTIDEAIVAHDGQGRMARSRYQALSPDRKRALVAFVGAL
jgi:CxxC motif-containing protein (DUF1111 family)